MKISADPSAEAASRGRQEALLSAGLQLLAELTLLVRAVREYVERKTP